MSEQLQLNFDGPDLEKEDHVRLAGQILAIFSVMQDRTWRTLAEIARVTGAPEASASAQLRHLRKARFGGHTVERRRRGAGLYEYRLIENVTPLIPKDDAVRETRYYNE